MSVTREETITNLEKLAALFYTESEQSKMVDYSKIIETLEFAAAALRSVSREQVEQVWRSYWDGFSNDYADGYEVYDEWQCRKCGFEVETDDPETLPQFCPSCGAPMTGEAVEMVMERLEALKDDRGRKSVSVFCDCCARKRGAGQGVFLGKESPTAHPHPAERAADPGRP